MYPKDNLQRQIIQQSQQKKTTTHQPSFDGFNNNCNRLIPYFYKVNKLQPERALCRFLSYELFIKHGPTISKANWWKSHVYLHLCSVCLTLGVTRLRQVQSKYLKVMYFLNIATI